MSAAHTPGPWHLERAADFTTFIDSSVGRLALMVHTSAVSTEANARLIAAAPELLAALQALVADAGNACDNIHDNSYIVHGEELDAARAAIAKAVQS